MIWAIAVLITWLGAAGPPIDPVSQAQLLVQSGDYPGALKLLAPLLATDPKNVQGQLTAAAACIAMKNDYCGEEHLKAAKKSASESSEYQQLTCRLNLIRAEDALTQGDQEKSLAYGQKAADAISSALSKTPGQPKLLALRAISLRASGRSHEALKAYETWRVTEPRNPDVYGATTALLVDLKRWNDTAALLASAPTDDESVRLAIDIAVLRNGLGRVPWTSTQPLFDSVRARNADPQVERMLEIYQTVLVSTERPKSLKVLDYLDANPGDARGLGAAFLARYPEEWNARGDIGDDVALPTLVSERPPTYPKLARGARIEGSVILLARIREDGSVGSLHVLKSTSAMFNQSAADSVRSRRYRPATRAGRPIEVPLVIRVDFRLR
ncbi:MAG TPA: TonB family protein [Candidatus Polarisedimenticolaceae bacterium]|nr:TonB family protein [Candidatus Polarisedimenticolaceae bacterium]